MEVWRLCSECSPICDIPNVIYDVLIYDTSGETYFESCAGLLHKNDLYGDGKKIDQYWYPMDLNDDYIVVAWKDDI